MSRRKERKIKSLKRRVIWPRIVGMIFTDFLILVFTGFITYLSVLGFIDSHVLKNDVECEKIVNLVNTEMKGSTTEVLNTKISAVVDALDSIHEVYVLDGDFNLVAGSGSHFEQVKKNYPNPEKAKRRLERGEVIRTSIYSDSSFQKFYKLSDETALDNIIRNFAVAINFIDFSKSRKNLKWGNSLVDVQGQWVLYKTELPDTYVCFNSVYLINNFQSYFFGFIILFYVLVILVILFFEIIHLISFCTDAANIDVILSTDMITGGKNKEWFIQMAKKRIRSQKRYYAIVQIRMEKYRNYCTSYGIKQGENLLELFNSNIERVIDRREISAHIEKADFALLLNYDNELQLKERINYIINTLVAVRKTQHLTFVAGVAKVNSKTDDINSLISASALALGKAENDSSHIVWFNDSMKEEQVWERRIEDDMESALENNEFQLYLQPKYSTKGEKLSAAEALVRWIHPVLGFISPGKFIPIFENNGFILKLDDYMLTAVAKQQAKWMNEGKTLVPISVNVSRAHFTKDDLAEHICKIVDEYSVPHKYIELELTESAFFDDKAVLLNTVKKLKSYGFAVSMDDFGAGYSSLNSLKELPLDVIKLDAEFFRGIDDVNRANLIVSDTISLAKKLGMSIVAEGIETREQVDFLANQNCDLIQGFYFAKPLPINEFEERAYPEEK